MEQIKTIGAVSKILGISSRMLRYYEQVGLIESQRTEDYAYRVYNENTVRRLRQIIILRKLRVPVKQIREIFDNDDAAKVVEVFEHNVTELDEQITALSTVRAILSHIRQKEILSMAWDVVQPFPRALKSPDIFMKKDYRVVFMLCPNGKTKILAGKPLWHY